MHRPYYTGDDLRLIECWLPLAQQANIVYKWGYDTRQLEKLIQQASSDLGKVYTTLEAQAILWHYYCYNRRRKRT